MKKPLKVVLSGGGTGGHIYPAISLAQSLQSKVEGCQVHFLGALGRMEMRVIPTYGYTIKGLPIRGLDRKNMMANIGLPFQLATSFLGASSELRQYKPDLVIGTGGYASAPTLWGARRLGIPYFIQEQNAFAGLTNKKFAKGAKGIFTAFPRMEKYFPETPVYQLGNPIRSLKSFSKEEKDNFKTQHGFEINKPLLLIVGGSLGARTFNNAMKNSLQLIQKEEVQVLWQTGRNNFPPLEAEFKDSLPANIKMVPYLPQMDEAYHMADLVVSRAGAISIAEIAAYGKPALLVPSPNVTDDHQTVNAQVYAALGGAQVMKDNEAQLNLIATSIAMLKDQAQLDELSQKATLSGRPHAADAIVDQILSLI